MNQWGPIIRVATALSRAAQQSRQRRLLLLTGGRAWAREAAERVLAALAPSAVVCLSDHPIGGCPPLPMAKAHTLLGQECDGLVFDAFAGFDVEALGAASGVLRGGGLMLLLAPPLADWGAFADPQRERLAVHPRGADAVSGRFLGRLARVAGADPALIRVQEGGPVPTPAVLPGASPSPVDQAPAPFATTEQASAVAAIERVVTGHRRRPLVLTADRGRGKSAALGLAAGRLLRQRGLRIVITAPRRDAAAVVFEHAARLLPHAEQSRNRIVTASGSLTFIAPDELIRTAPEADLLLVDEAATIPAPLLERLLAGYSRIAFATTVHGYEGTGRGFAVRFRRVLDSRTPGWRELRLQQPVRWAANDPLERFIFEALLLAAAPVTGERVAEATAATCSVEPVDRDWLVSETALLNELFGLLVLAHYRTSPLDLRHLLDGPNLTVWLVRYQGHVVATALVAREGGFDATTARAIWEGRRRPQGHMLPESLAAHLGLLEAPELVGSRVVRIAVHPALQGRGIGSRLLAAVAEAGRSAGDAWLGTAFGATPDLLAFWSRNSFAPVRLSIKRSATSGSHSALLLRPLPGAGERLFTQARSRFLRYLPDQLSDPLRVLEPAVALPLLRGAPGAPLDRQDWLDVAAFAEGRRVYETVVGPLRKAAVLALAAPGLSRDLAASEREALLLRVLQGRDWQACAEALELPGRRQVTEVLRRAFREVLRHCDPGDAVPDASAVEAEMREQW